MNMNTVADLQSHEAKRQIGEQRHINRQRQIEVAAFIVGLLLLLLAIAR